MKKKVKFEKWLDPLNSNVDEVEWPGYNQNEDGEVATIHSPKMTQILHTPFGALSLTGNALAVNQFDFWTMYSNFDITHEIRDIVKQVPGVETLDIQTRYRARVGIPKSGFFSAGQVMHDIQVAITQVERNKQNQLLIGLPVNVAHSVISMRDKVDDKHDNWALLVLPNGQIEVVASDKADETYKTQLEVLNSTSKFVGGRLITSEV